MDKGERQKEKEKGRENKIDIVYVVRGERQRES